VDVQVHGFTLVDRKLRYQYRVPYWVYGASKVHEERVVQLQVFTSCTSP